MNEPKSVLITGANGFLASELIEQLLATNKYKIIALSRNKANIIEKYNEQVLSYDYQDLDNNEINFKNVDFLVHTAFSRGYKSKNEIANSLNLTKKIFVTAITHKVKSIINISSQGVYSNEYVPLWTEQTPASPDYVYGFAKYATELILDTVKECVPANDCSITNLRLASLTGARDGLQPEVISKFVEMAITKGKINVIGGKQLLSYLDVRDAADSLISIMNRDFKKWHKIYNVGPNKQYNIKDIALLVQNIAKNKHNIEVELILEAKEIMLNVGMNASLFYEQMKWKPKYSLKDTLIAIFNYKIKGI